jgi:uncharacterized protein (UPF0335 family)
VVSKKEASFVLELSENFNKGILKQQRVLEIRGQSIQRVELDKKTLKENILEKILQVLNLTFEVKLWKTCVFVKVEKNMNKTIVVNH